MHQIIQLSCEGSCHHTATHLLKTSQPPPEALCAGHFTKPQKAFVIFGRLLMLPLLREKGYYMPHMSGFEDETAGDPS